MRKNYFAKFVKYAKKVLNIERGLENLKDGYIRIKEDAFNVMETHVGESNILRWTNNEKKGGEQ